MTTMHGNGNGNGNGNGTGNGKALSILPAGELRLRNVLTKGVADRLPTALVVGVGMALLGLWMGPLYNQMSAALEDLAENLPEGATAIFGDIATPAGWMNAELFSMMAPAALLYVGFVSAARAFATEVEEKSMGLLAVNPISRTGLFLQKTAAIQVHVAVVAVLTALGTWLGVAVGGLGIPVGNVLAIVLHLWLLGAGLAALAAVIAIVSGRRMSTIVASSAAAGVMYSWAVFLPVSASLEPVAKLSPWYWFHGPDVLTNGPALGYLLLLVVFVAALIVAGLQTFKKRELPA